MATRNRESFDHPRSIVSIDKLAASSAREIRNWEDVEPALISPFPFSRVIEIDRNRERRRNATRVINRAEASDKSG